MLFAHVMVNANISAFQQSPERFHAVSVSLVSHIFANAVSYAFMLISFNPFVPTMTIAVNRGTSLYVLYYSGLQLDSVCAVDGERSSLPVSLMESEHG